MKFKNLILAITVLCTVCACSSDDDSDSNPVASNSFTFFVNGEEIELPNTLGQRSDNTLVAQGVSSDGYSVDVVFHKEGNLAGISVLVPTLDFPDFYSEALFYSANTLDFDLIEVNDSDNSISGVFEGQLFEDNIDIENSPSITVSGEFNIPYIEVTPQISGLEVFAQIDGDDWYRTKGYVTSGTSSDPISQWSHNETKYHIGFEYLQETLAVGTYSFDGTTNINKMMLFENSESLDGEGVTYSTEGTVSITEVNSSFGFTQVIGTFNFIATNPDTGESIEVTNGRINDLY